MRDVHQNRNTAAANRQNHHPHSLGHVIVDELAGRPKQHQTVNPGLDNHILIVKQAGCIRVDRRASTGGGERRVNTTR
jgi:hypothetical protein